MFLNLTPVTPATRSRHTLLVSNLPVPTLVVPSYDRTGRLQGNQLAQVPIPDGLPQNGYISSAPVADYSVPCSIYGSELTELEWYMTNESGDRVDEQKANCSITLTIGWDDPDVRLGAAGAEDDPADVRQRY